jgi:D-psicose/D-tagatose/L-ribulose 3-epimerase
VFHCEHSSEKQGMKIGMNLYLWLARLEPQHFSLLATLRDCGFDGVEIPTGDYTDSELAAIRTELDALGLACTVATLLGPEVNPIDEDAAVRSAAVTKIQQDLRVCSGLGAEALVGPMHSGHKVFCGRGPNPQEFSWAREFLQATGAAATAAKVRLAVEPLNRFECYFLNTAEQAGTLMDAVSLPGVGVLYDTHHANIEETDVYTAITGLGQQLSHFHLSESHRGTPGTGMVDWHNSFRALQDMNYQHWIVIEAFGTGVEGIPDAVNIWRNCFNSELEVAQAGLAMIRRHI